MVESATGEVHSGQLIGNQYRVLTKLGDGGMSHVYLCEDISLNRQVAIKVMRADALLSKQALLRFQREGKAVAGLLHPNIVKVHSLQFTEDQQPFLVMEVINGTPLNQIIEFSGPVNVTRALKFLIQICDGIAHAHANSIIHRDLKPGNIMILNLGLPSESVKILDFGIAKVTDEKSVKATQTGEIFGSPAYMSPEQAMGKPIDVKTDQYSLGCIAFELLTGRPPFIADNQLALLMAHIQDPPPSLKSLVKESISTNLERTIAKLLAKNPADRFASIEEVKKALNGEIKVGKTATTGTLKRSSKKTLAIASGILLIAGLIAIAFLSWRKIAQTESTAQPTIIHSEQAITADPEVVKDNTYLAELIRQNPGRTTFDDLLNTRKISDDALKYFRYCPRLQCLKLEDCPNITSAGIATLAQLPIPNLNLNKTNIDDSALLSLSRMPGLLELHLDNVDHITNKGLEYLTHAPALENLSISNYLNATVDTLEIVSRIKNLKVLRVNNGFHASGTHFLTRNKLVYLEMSRCSPQEGELLPLGQIKTLEALILDSNKIDKPTLMALSRLPNLTTLTLRESFVTPEDLKAFKRLKPKCNVEFLEKSKVLKLNFIDLH